MSLSRYTSRRRLIVFKLESSFISKLQIIQFHSALSPRQTRKHCFLPMFRHVSQSGQTLGNIVAETLFRANVSPCFPEWADTIGNIRYTYRNIGKHRMFLNLLETFLLLGKQILFPQQCFHGWANRETFEETSRITIVSTTMFPSLPRALSPHESA